MNKLYALAAALACLAPSGSAADPRPYWVCVSNEISDDVTVIDGLTQKVVATIPAGKRPRGIHASPDGAHLYVALSGSPLAGPPKLDAVGKPIFDPELEKKADHTADAIGVIDLRQRKLLRKIPSGTDPEEFAVGRDSKRLYVSN